MADLGRHVSFKQTQEGTPGVRYGSGRLVYDEQLVDGRWVGRYWSANGQLVPEMHLTKEKTAEDARSFPMQSFRLGIGGVDLTEGWTWLSAGPGVDTTGLRDESGSAKVFTVRLAHVASSVEVRVNTRLDGSAMIVRWLDVVNTGTVPLGISSLFPMSGRVWCHAPDNFIAYALDEVLAEDSGHPLQVAYDHLQTWGREADFRFEPVGSKGFRTGSRNGKSGHGRPAFWLRNRLNGETFVCEFAFSGNWDMEILHEDKRRLMQAGFAMGMGPLDSEVLRVLDPGETVSSPLMHVGLFHCEDDAITQSLHEHVRTVVLPKVPPGRECEIEANHRGYLCDREDEPSMKEDEEVAAAIGAELYMVDAGWYGRMPNEWWNNAGDWFAGEWLPNGLEPIAEHAHALGMRFGLWVEVEAAGKNTDLKRDHPEWLLSRHGIPVVGGRALDYTNPEVLAWIEPEIARIIRQYKLDLFRIDHNHSMGTGGTRTYKGFTENLMWRYYENFYGVFDRARRAFPDVAFQNCAGGGGRLDLGILQQFHNTEMSDWMRKPRDIRIFSNLTQSLPPEILLRTFGTEFPELSMDGDIDLQMRLVILCRPIFRGIAPSRQEMNPWFLERVRHHLAIFRETLRPLMLDGLVYHHTPMLPIEKGSPWVVLEYGSKDRKRAVAALFRTSSDNCAYRLHPRGLDQSGRYLVRFDNSGETFELSGHEIVDGGIRVEIGCQLSSELIRFERVG